LTIGHKFGLMSEIWAALTFAFVKTRTVDGVIRSMSVWLSIS
jgi:hypothetical protein